MVLRPRLFPAWLVFLPTLASPPAPGRAPYQDDLLSDCQMGSTLLDMVAEHRVRPLASSLVLSPSPVLRKELGASDPMTTQLANSGTRTQFWVLTTRQHRFSMETSKRFGHGFLVWITAGARPQS